MSWIEGQKQPLVEEKFAGVKTVWRPPGIFLQPARLFFFKGKLTFFDGDFANDKAIFLLVGSSTFFWTQGFVVFKDSF